MMAQMRIDLQRRLKAEAFPWARVEPMGNGIQLALGIPRQIRALRQVLAQQAIGILVGPALPGAVRIGKEDLDRETLRQPLMVRHLFAPIVGQRFPQRGGHLSELLGEAPVGTGGIRAVHSDQQHQSRGPFHQGAHSRAIAGAFQQVAFPVARHSSGGDVGRSFGDRGHIGNLAPAVSASRPWATSLASQPQGGQQFAPQAPPWQHIQGRVDGFGREVFAHVIRIRASETPSNLLRRAACGQLCGDVLPQPRVEEFPDASWVMGSGRRVALCRAGAIGTASGRVPGHLATQGTGGSAQDSGHRTERMAVGQAQTHGLTFFRSQVSVRSRMHGNTLAHRGWQCCTWS